MAERYLNVESCLSGFKETKISPSAVPTVARSLLAILIPLLGRPMLSTIATNCSAGIKSLITASTLLNTRSVSSIRVPGGTRTCNLNDPASTFGKKSLPMKLAKTPDMATIEAIIIITRFVWFKHHLSRER